MENDTNEAIMEERSPKDLLAQDASVIAAVPKEAFKAMFYLFAGKPDSKVKMMNRRVIVTPDDIKDLNLKITDKLKLHNIDQSVTTAIIKFDKEESVEFGTWTEFETYDFKIHYTTKEISIRWDFLIKLNSYAVPQRHTLIVRLSKRPNPQDIFRMVLSQDPDDDIDLESKIGLCMARVDFISHRLADELIDVVEKWNKSLLQPESSCGWFCKLEKFDKYIATTIHHSIPVMISLLSLVSLPKLFNDELSTVSANDLIIFGRWLLMSFILIFIFISIGKYLAAKCYVAINEYGIYTPFQITRGDKNRIKKINERNKKKIKSFFINSGAALSINILAGIIVWWLLPKP